MGTTPMYAAMFAAARARRLECHRHVRRSRHAPEVTAGGGGRAGARRVIGVRALPARTVAARQHHSRPRRRYPGRVRRRSSGQRYASAATRRPAGTRARGSAVLLLTT